MFSYVNSLKSLAHFLLLQIIFYKLEIESLLSFLFCIYKFKRNIYFININFIDSFNFTLYHIYNRTSNENLEGESVYQGSPIYAFQK